MAPSDHQTKRKIYWCDNVCFDETGTIISLGEDENGLAIPFEEMMALIAQADANLKAFKARRQQDDEQ